MSTPAPSGPPPGTPATPEPGEVPRAASPPPRTAAAPSPAKPPASTAAGSEQTPSRHWQPAGGPAAPVSAAPAPRSASRRPAAAPRSAAALRAEAQAAAAPLPPLLAEAERLAASVAPGAHGRRRAGMGAEFWQYRPAHAGDPARLIDWRRSARSDAQFVREREWQAAQPVLLWADSGRSMQFASAPGLPAKAQRAALIALAAAILLARGGERVGCLSPQLPPRGGQAQIYRLAEALGGAADASEYGLPQGAALAAGARVLLVSDFLGDLGALAERITAIAAQGIAGAALMVLDPQEELFPFDGRTLFESIGGSLSFETRRARDLRSQYLERLAARKARLAQLAAQSGWQFSTHHTDQPAAGALLWLYGALGGALGGPRGQR